MKRGFILGKFMPLHRGHLLAFDVACSLVDELTILVCSRDCEPINGKLRLEWVRQSVKSSTRVLHLDRDIPQEPSENTNFWSIWRDTINEFHPEPIDVVFGSDEYIVELANVVSARPFLVDLDRQIVPVSASRIRENPIQHWNHIPAAVRPYYQQRICLLGPESSGKSTLTSLLAQTFGSRYISEYGRTYDAVFRRGTGWTDSDFTELARGHAAISHETCKIAGPVVFEDTDLLQTLVWARYLLGHTPEQLHTCLPDWTPADSYLLLAPDTPWVDDGTRYSKDSNTRQWFFNELLKLLQTRQLNHEIISGNHWADRSSKAISCCQRIISQ